MSRVKCFVILAGALLLAGCAAQGELTSTGTGPGAESVVAAPSSVAQATSAAPQIQSARPQVLPQIQSTRPQAMSLAPQNATAPPRKVDVNTAGYEHIVRNGKEFFCRSEAIAVDSHIKQKACYTAAQLRAQQEYAQRMLEGMSRSSASGVNNPGMCGGASGSANQCFGR